MYAIVVPDKNDNDNFGGIDMDCLHGKMLVRSFKPSRRSIRILADEHVGEPPAGLPRCGSGS